MNDSGQITLDDLKAQLQSQTSVSVRLAITSEENGTRVLHAMAVDAFPTVPMPTFVYDYGRVTFVSDNVSGAMLAAWLDNEKGEASGCPFAIPRRAPQNISWNRYPSHTNDGYLRARWPFTRFEVYPDSSSPPRDPALNSVGYLASNTCPFFPDYRSAAFELIYRVKSREPGWNVPREIIDLRFAHPEAWLEQIHFSPMSLTITIEGSDVLGTRLEVVGSPDLRWDTKPAQPGEYMCPLPNGSPTDLWIVLSRDNLRLDYRYLNHLWSPFSPKIENVTVEPPDAGTRLEELIYRGEGETTEFKSQVSGTNKDRLLRTVAAFANGEGGVILIGVDNSGLVVGVNQPLREEKDRITDMIRRSVTPEPRVRLEDGKVNAKNIVAVYVDKGETPPYGLLPDPPKFYIRRQASTFAAHQDEIRVLGQRNAGIS